MDNFQIEKFKADEIEVVEVWDDEVWSNPASFVARVRDALNRCGSVVPRSTDP